MRHGLAVRKLDFHHRNTGRRGADMTAHYLISCPDCNIVQTVINPHMLPFKEHVAIRCSACESIPEAEDWILLQVINQLTEE